MSTNEIQSKFEIILQKDKEDIILSDTIDKVPTDELIEKCVKADSCTIFLDDATDVVAKNEAWARLSQFRDMLDKVANATEEPKLVFKGSIRESNGVSERKGISREWRMVKLYKGLSSGNDSQAMLDKLSSLIV
tara:strand:+ start:249 stop:650 length:402 start_codon:yes stop_codon:yes gene_type:complete